MRFWFRILFVALFLWGTMQPGYADIQKDVAAELKALRNEFEQMKDMYEKRIRQLEDTIANVEGRPGSHKAAPVASYGGVMNPDVSVVVNAKADVIMGDAGSADRYKLKLDHVELALQGYLYPGIRGDVVAALEQTYTSDNVSTAVHLEEAYASFLDLPLGIQAEVGRKFMHFGKLNPIHAHHWPVVDRPRVLRMFFGHDNWYDDGISASVLIPNPWEVYVQQRVGYFNGRDMEAGGMDHINWDGNIFLSRTNANVPLPFDENGDIGAGYSLAFDEGNNTQLHGADVTFSYRWPQSYRKFNWITELLFADIESFRQEPFGLYSLANLTLDKNWDVGVRYDYTEHPDNSDDHEWGGATFLTYHLNEAFYLRGQYRYRELIGGHDDEHALMMQLVWGMGPHAHRLED